MKAKSFNFQIPMHSNEGKMFKYQPTLPGLTEAYGGQAASNKDDANTVFYCFYVRFDWTFRCRAQNEK